MSLRQEEKLVERRVNYTLELDGKFYIVENVPARVDEETGEQYFRLRRRSDCSRSSWNTSSQAK